MINDWTTNYWIDHIQTTKKTMVDTLVKDESMSTPLKEFIEAQTTFTKIAVKSMNDFANATGDAFVKGKK